MKTCGNIVVFLDALTPKVYVSVADGQFILPLFHFLSARLKFESAPPVLLPQSWLTSYMNHYTTHYMGLNVITL